MTPYKPTYENFKKFEPQWYVRKATGEKVQAIKTLTEWEFEDFKVGDFVVMDGPRIYRCPPTRFYLIFQMAGDVQ